MAGLGKNIKKLLVHCAITSVAVLFIGWVSYESWLLTIHAVIPKQVYRSAQLPATTLEYFVKSKHIKTVINMRGPHPQALWYEKEVNAMKKLGVKHYDIAMESYKIPSKERMRKLLYLLMTAPRPILVHCLGGADRSGFASALAMILHGNPSIDKSEQQFSLAYLVISKQSVGKRVFPYYTRWLQEHHLKHNRTNFLKWACSKEPFHRNYSYPYPKDLGFYNQSFMSQMCGMATNSSP